MAFPVIASCRLWLRIIENDDVAPAMLHERVLRAGVEVLSLRHAHVTLMNESIVRCLQCCAVVAIVHCMTW